MAAKKRGKNAGYTINASINFVSSFAYTLFVSRSYLISQAGETAILNVSYVTFSELIINLNTTSNI